MSLSGIGELPLFKRRSSGQEEIEALLDLFPHPTVIINALSGRILFANARTSQLTAYTRRELNELEIGTLLPDLPKAQLLDKEQKPVTQLITRSSRKLTIQIATEALGGQDHWLALSFSDPNEIDESVGKLSKQRWEAIHVLSLALQQKGDLGSVYHQILKAGKLLTGAAHVAIYLANGRKGTLYQISLTEQIGLPREIAAADLENFRTPFLWQPGKPAEHLFHKLALSTKLRYLATSPIDPSDPKKGIILAAERDRSPAKELLSFLEILGAAVLTTHLHRNSINKLMSELSDLKGVELFLSAMQEHVQDGIVITDHDLKILDINPAAETMLGYVAGEAIGRPAADILISSETLLPSLESAVQKNTVHQIGERKLHKRDGFEFLASLRAIPLEQGEGRPRLLILISDLSEHEAVHLQNQQLQQRAAIGEVTAIFAHEVRNPINSISTGLQLIQMNLQEDDPLKDQIRTIQGDVDRLEHRMKAVDSFSRNLDPHPEALDLGEFCRNQLDRWRPRMNRKNIKDHIQIASGTHLVLADRRALDQVLTNLITNAIQAMEEQESGILAIRVRPSPDDPKFVDLHISDSGPGIPEDIRKRIFEPFFTTKGNEGTGLGLAISKRIIMAHHGKIECDSFPGGTLFKIQLPVAPQTDLEGSLPNGS